MAAYPARTWHAIRIFSLLSVAFFCAGPATLAQQGQNWPVYGGSAGNTHYSILTQINRGNVKDLQVAWSFDTGEEGGLQTNPIIVDGVLYGITPTQKIFALNAASGKLVW